LAVSHLLGADEITPPLGVDWGEAENHLERRLAGAKAKVVEKRVVEGRDMWTVEGLIQANLRRTIFYFKNGGLSEVEFQYQNDQWAEVDYGRLLSDLRQRLEARLGSGKLIARSKIPQGDVTESVVGYQWNKGTAAIQVIYFGAESKTQAYRTVSLHYKSLE
jgi:hypothetical protein